MINICILNSVQQIIKLTFIYINEMIAIFNRNTMQKTILELKLSMKRYKLICLKKSKFIDST
jgi:hypothetical protein